MQNITLGVLREKPQLPEARGSGGRAANKFLRFSRKKHLFKHGPTKHRKELQGTENSAKNYKVLQGTTRYFQTKHKVAENTKELQGTFKPTTR